MFLSTSALLSITTVFTTSLGLTVVTPHTASGTLKPSKNSSNLDPVPNPFPVPGTSITLDFLPQPIIVPQPPAADVLRLLNNANAQITAHIHAHGNGPLRNQLYLLRYREAEIAMTSPMVALDPFTYGDALSVILGMSLKMGIDGYREESSRVLRTGSLDLLGFAAVYLPVDKDGSA